MKAMEGAVKTKKVREMARPGRMNESRAVTVVGQEGCGAARNTRVVADSLAPKVVVVSMPGRLGLVSCRRRRSMDGCRQNLGQRHAATEAQATLVCHPARRILDQGHHEPNSSCSHSTTRTLLRSRSHGQSQLRSTS